MQPMLGCAYDASLRRTPSRIAYRLAGGRVLRRRYLNHFRPLLVEVPYIRRLTTKLGISCNLSERHNHLAVMYARNDQAIRQKTNKQLISSNPLRLPMKPGWPQNLYGKKERG